MMPLIFNASYEGNPWMEDEEAFDSLSAQREQALAKKKEEQVKASSAGLLRKAARRLLRG